MPIFYRVQNYCYFVKYAIPIIWKRYTIIKPHSKRVLLFRRIYCNF